MRYGNPIVVLNLVKRNEKRPREMWLGREFEAAIEYANKQVSISCICSTQIEHRLMHLRTIFKSF